LPYYKRRKANQLRRETSVESEEVNPAEEEAMRLEMEEGFELLVAQKQLRNVERISLYREYKNRMEYEKIKHNIEMQKMRKEADQLRF